MLSLLSNIPLPWRLGLAGVVIAGLWFGGYRHGESHVQEKFDAFKAETKAAADKQAAETADKIKAQEKITKETGDAYEQKLAALRALAPTEQRVRVDDGRCTVRTFSNTAQRPDASRSHPESVVAGGAPIATAGNGGSSDGATEQGDAGQVAADKGQAGDAEAEFALCRATTLQLSWLQHWVRQQQAVK